MAHLAGEAPSTTSWSSGHCSQSLASDQSSDGHSGQCGLSSPRQTGPSSFPASGKKGRGRRRQEASEAARKSQGSNKSHNQAGIASPRLTPPLPDPAHSTCYALRLAALMLPWLPGLRTGPKAPPHVALLSQILQKSSWRTRVQDHPSKC